MNVSNTRKLSDSVLLPAFCILILWFIHITQFLFGWNLGYLGVYPREIFGIKGVLTAPLIHADWGHLVSNSIPFFVVSTMIMYFYRSVAIKSMVMIYLFTGLAVWILAKQVFHIGASGVVYGLVAFIFGNGIFRRNLKSIVLALIVTLLYSGMVVGFLPKEGISWESHLYGALVGIFTAFFYKGELEADEIQKENPWADEPAYADRPYFLHRDTFLKTKEERRLEAEERRRQAEIERAREEAERTARKAAEDDNYNDGWFSSNT